MSVFTEKEIEGIKEQRLGRLATVDAEGGPRVVPVGRRLAGTKKFRDAGATGRAAFLVDDVLPPWHGVEVRGSAEVLSEGGAEVMKGFFSEELIRIFPERIVAPLGSDAFDQNSRAVG